MATNNSVNTSLSGQTGTGSFAGSNSPTLVTPILGVASATSINFGVDNLAYYNNAIAITPTFTFSTPGDLSVTYSTQSGNQWRIGNMFFLNYVIVFTPTWTTASGTARFAGLPVTPGYTFYMIVGNKSSTITFPASCTQIVAVPTVGQTYATLAAFGSTTAQTALTTANFTSGVSHTLAFSGAYGV